MATPQSTTSQDNAPGKSKKLEQITFRFCSECSNMLYPKEDEDAHKLQFTCRTCQYTEDAQTTCVFRNILNTSAGETAGVTQDVGSDPTVSDDFCPVVCLCCGIVIPCLVCRDPLNHTKEPGHLQDAMVDDYSYTGPDCEDPACHGTCSRFDAEEEAWERLRNDCFVDEDDEALMSSYLAASDSTDTSDGGDLTDAMYSMLFTGAF
jgi:DNA-directed RNA polymerase II subunit RPB9